MPESTEGVSEGQTSQSKNHSARSQAQIKRREHAAKQIRLIEKAKPHAHAAIQQSSLNAEVETRLEQMIESVKESRVMGDINPRFLAFLEDLLKTKVD